MSSVNCNYWLIRKIKDMKLGGDCVETEKLGGLKIGVVNFTTHVYISQKNERINILT